MNYDPYSEAKRLAREAQIAAILAIAFAFVAVVCEVFAMVITASGK